MYKPNLNMPLATSYNERGVAGFTHTQTNSEDQRKINCFYEVMKNPLTGQGKLSLSKRPGVTINASSFGLSTQAAFGITTDFFSGLTKAALVSSPIVFANPNAATNRIIAYGGSGSSTAVSLSSGGSVAEIFLDKTFISNVETIVIQARSQATLTAQERTYFSGSSVGAAWTEISDSDFTGGVGPPFNDRFRGKMEHMDGFAFILLNNNSIINSDLNSLANWTATSFINKLVISDAPVGLTKFSNQILAFGENSVESFYNAGNATGSPLLPIKQLANKIGMVRTSFSVGANYSCILNNKLFFIGRRAGGQASVGLFSYNGSVYEKVSPLYIDKIIGEKVDGDSYFSIGTFGFNGQSAIAISFTPVTATTQRWLMFLPDWNDWFEWNSTVFGPINNGEFFLGVPTNQQRVYNFTSSDNWQDNGTSYTAQTQFKLPYDGHQRKRMAEFGVLADTARSTNMLSVEFSDDDYISFINIGAIDLARDIKTLNRGGSYRQRAVRLSSTNALETRLHAFVARVE